MKVLVEESSKVAVKVFDLSGKLIEKISVGKKLKLDAIKNIFAKYEVKSIDYRWKISGIGGAGLWNSAYNMNSTEFINIFA